MYLTLEILSSILCGIPMHNQKDLRAWVLQNRGVQSAIAEHLGLTRQFVSGVLLCKYYSDRGKIEGILADLGAPGMRERECEAKAKMRKITWTDREKKRLMDQLRKIQADKAKRAVA